MERREIDVSLITPNKGQVPGLPRNPRLVKKERYDATKRSIEESPEMLELRELIVVEYMEDRYVVVCGNLRLRACKELGYKTVPCKVLPGDTPAKKLREYAAKDNINYGEDDKDIIANEWAEFQSELADWGMEFEQPKQKDKFRERFDAMDNDSAVYPLIPKYDEKHELFIIQSSNEVDSNWLREILDMQHMRSYKTGKVSKSNVISIKDFREAITKAQKGEAS
jgi:hypothetical protein